MDEITLRLFGAPHVAFNQRAGTFRLQKELALLIYLAETSAAHTRMSLATLFWPELDTSRALGSLRRTLYQLKVDIGASVVEFHSDQVRMRSDLAIRLDTHEFLVAAHACSHHAHSPDSPLATCVASLHASLALYQDDFLSGFSLTDCPYFDEWQYFEREGLKADYLRIVASLTAYYERHGDGERGAETAMLWLRREPCHEPAHRALMRLYLQSGQIVAARRQYEVCRRILAEQLGVAPADETERLYRQIGTARYEWQPRPHTRYVRSGDAYLAFQTIGEGDIDIVNVGGFITHVEQLWDEPGLVRFYTRLGHSARVIVYDKRGVGLSDRVVRRPTTEQHVADVLAILGEVGANRVIIFAVSDGAAVAIELAITYPEQVAGLIIYGGQAKGVRGDDYPWGLTEEQYERWSDRLVKGWGGPVNLEYFTPTCAHDERLRLWWAQTQRLAASPGAVKAILDGIRDSDVRAVLPQVGVPTLVIHRRGDRSVHVESGRYLANNIPQAQFIELPGDDHWWWVGDTESLHTAVERFVTQVQR